MTLTQEQKETLQVIMEQGHWDAVVALANALVHSHEQSVLKTSSEQHSRKLVIEHARLEGARSVARGIAAIKKSLKD